MIVSKDFWECFKQYCGCYIGGVKGTGKTLLASAIAEEVSNRWRVPADDLKDFTTWGGGSPRYRVFSNFPLAFNSDITPDLLDGDGLHHALIIIDEAGSRWASARNWNDKAQNEALSVTDYARKQELFFITPSASSVDKSLREFTIFRNMIATKLLTAVGLGEIAWHYIARPVGQKPFGFFLWFPYAYYPIYSTRFIPGVHADAVIMLMNTFQKRYAYDRTKAEAARAALEQTLKEGGTIPALLPQQVAQAVAATAAAAAI